jgi:hypothetical protein
LVVDSLAVLAGDWERLFEPDSCKLISIVGTNRPNIPHNAAYLWYEHNPTGLAPLSAMHRLTAFYHCRARHMLYSRALSKYHLFVNSGPIGRFIVYSIVVILGSRWRVAEKLKEIERVMTK